MIDIFLTRLRQGYRTMEFPSEAVNLPDRFCGRPRIDAARCPADCRDCVAACPSGAIAIDPPHAVDLGRCLFCGECARACQRGTIVIERDYRLATRKRADLVATEPELKLAAPLEAPLRQILGRSLKLRQVSAGGCNACEADTNVLNTLAFDLGRFGVQFVASPRHADGLLITGPVSRNMELALRKTYAAVPAPCLVIAVGACAISGGLYADHPEVVGGAEPLLPVDLYVPGCPPHPLTILDGLLRLLGRIQDRPVRRSTHAVI